MGHCDSSLSQLINRDVTFQTISYVKGNSKTLKLQLSLSATYECKINHLPLRHLPNVRSFDSQG